MRRKRLQMVGVETVVMQHKQISTSFETGVLLKGSADQVDSEVNEQMEDIGSQRGGCDPSKWIDWVFGTQGD